MALVEYKEQGGIGYITLNRPEKLNAFSDDMSADFMKALYDLNDDPKAQVGILSGTGRAFCSGADVKQRQLRSREEYEKLGGAAGRHVNYREALFRSSQSKPIIAAVHGYALGIGLRLSMYSDMLVAAKGTKFQVTEVPRGINGIPFWMMLNQVGAGVFATDVSMTGRIWLAEEAAANGLITRLAEPGEHLQEAEKLAREVLKNPPLAVRAIVEARRASLEELEVKAYAIRPRTLHLSEDFRESALAYVEKRAPVFKGR